MCVFVSLLMYQSGMHAVSKMPHAEEPEDAWTGWTDLAIALYISIMTMKLLYFYL